MYVHSKASSGVFRHLQNRPIFLYNKRSTKAKLVGYWIRIIQNPNSVMYFLSQLSDHSEIVKFSGTYFPKL